MNRLIRMIWCSATGACTGLDDPQRRVAETRRLLRELDEAVTPMKRRINHEAAQKPDLATELKRAREALGRNVHAGDRP